MYSHILSLIDTDGSTHIPETIGSRNILIFGSVWQLYCKTVFVYKSLHLHGFTVHYWVKLIKPDLRPDLIWTYNYEISVQGVFMLSELLYCIAAKAVHVWIYLIITYSDDCGSYFTFHSHKTICTLHEAIAVMTKYFNGNFILHCLDLPMPYI